MAFDWGGNLVCAGSNIGIYSIPTADNRSTTPAKSAMTVTKSPSYLKGDVNCDGKVNLGDVSKLIAYLLGNNPQPFSFEAADMDNDNHISVGDMSKLISYLLSQ